MIKKVKNTLPLTYITEVLNGKKIVGMFYQKNNNNNNNKWISNIEKQKVNFKLSGKIIIIHLIVRLIRKISLCDMSYFPKPNT